MILKIYRDKDPLFENIEERTTLKESGWFQYEFVAQQHNSSLCCGPIDRGNKNFVLCSVPHNWKENHVLKKLINEVILATYYNDDKNLIKKRFEHRCKELNFDFVYTNCL